MLGIVVIGLIAAQPAMAATVTVPIQTRSTDYLLMTSAALEPFGSAELAISFVEDERQSPLLTAGSRPSAAAPGQPSGGTVTDPRQSPLLVVPEVVSAVPEPATWALMILGFGLVGSALRRRRPTMQFRSHLS